MDRQAIARKAADLVYALGVAICLILIVTALFGSTAVINPDAMLPITHRERAFGFLAAGAAPMLVACAVVYRLHRFHHQPHRWRNAGLIFLPGAICAACALFLVAILILGMINTFGG